LICDQDIIRVQKNIGSEVCGGGACGTILAHGLLDSALKLPVSLLLSNELHKVVFCIKYNV